ncbi:MAG: LCP family protein [Anaerolineae bacterium]|nr:LCP family protein [Anaerolineae bacterium]
MTRGKQITLVLTFVALGTTLIMLLITGNPASIFALPTLVPTISSPTLHPATPTATPPPPLTPTPTPDPTATFTPSPTETPTPTFTPTPFSLAEPVLIGVTPTLSDTTAIPTPVSVAEMAPGAINIVVLGSDRRPDWDDWHTDVIQIVSIQPLMPAVTVLSIPRDLYVYIPDFWMSRVNFADMYGELYEYEGGGPVLLQQTLLYNLGIPIDHYVRTDFDGLIGIVDAMGGVEIPVHCSLQDYWPYPNEAGEYITKTLEPGVHYMDGETALWYARSRLGPRGGGVFARERRQQQVLQAIWRQARNLDLLPRLPELWEQFRSMVVTDLEFGDVLMLAEVAFRLDEQNVRFRNIGYQHVIPWTTPKGGSVFLPNWEEIEPVVSEALGPVPEGRLWRTLQTVEVWNGTPNADWDQLATDRLFRQGFIAVIGQPDRRDYLQTQLIDFTSTTKGSAIPYLQWMFNVSASNVISAPDPNSAVQYRLIVGADYQTCRSP